MAQAEISVSLDRRRHQNFAGGKGRWHGRFRNGTSDFLPIRTESNSYGRVNQFGRGVIAISISLPACS
jgi:hypothetical protein